MVISKSWLVFSLLVLGLSAWCRPVTSPPSERFATFDADPGWEGRNNRATVPEPRTIRQDFGYSRTSHTGGQPGEVGGYITPAAEPAYYAKRIARRTLQDTLSASGTMNCKDRAFHLLLGFFNANTLKEWRTPNSISMRLLGRGDRFFVYVEYATAKWRASADSPGGFKVVKDPDTGREQFVGFLSGEPHKWSIRYDPEENAGNGRITVTVDDQKAFCDLSPGHKQDGAEFNRFGMLNILKSADGGGEVWVDDVTVNGETDRFDKEPKWEGVRNRETYVTAEVRPRFNFGYSKTRYAGGKADGEIGGLVFRGDNRYAERMGAYGDRIGPLSLDKPLIASGKITLRRGVSDSTTLIGFYHSRDSMQVSDSQSAFLPRSFFGIAIEGPSSHGFFIQPGFRNRADGNITSFGPTGLYIYPDGATHEWHFEYQPNLDQGSAEVTVTLGGKSVRKSLTRDQLAATTFDRFGIVTTWIDGNAQRVYLDDLRYTARHD
jgi:hypothetical protein